MHEGHLKCEARFAFGCVGVAWMWWATALGLVVPGRFCLEGLPRIPKQALGDVLNAIRDRPWPLRNLTNPRTGTHAGVIPGEARVIGGGVCPCRSSERNRHGSCGYCGD